MKKVIFFAFSLLFIFQQHFAKADGSIVIEGEYYNENVFIRNDYSSSGVGFCAYEVLINDNVSIDEINSSAFEIDLSAYDIPIGSPVTIKIKYQEGCKPHVLNASVLKPHPTFEATSIRVESNGLLTWSSVNETAALPYSIEQFKWGKWVKVGEVKGKGSAQSHLYKFKTTPHAGTNKFRVTQKGHGGVSKYSKKVSFVSLEKSVSFVYNKSSKTIEFSKETQYEVFNKYGSLVKAGFSSFVDVNNLEKDIYYINYGNITDSFKRR